MIGRGARLAGVALCSLILFAGCGGGDSTSGDGADQVSAASGGDRSIQTFGEAAGSADRAAATGAALAYLRARAAKRFRAACANTAAELRQQVGSFGSGEGLAACASGLASLTVPVKPGALREAARIQVAELRADGDRGYLILDDARGLPAYLPMSREDGRWLVAALVATPLTS